jgi:hypothetical protein
MIVRPERVSEVRGLIGAGRGNRTPTGLRPPDFEYRPPIRLTRAPSGVAHIYACTVMRSQGLNVAG